MKKIVMIATVLTSGLLLGACSNQAQQTGQTEQATVKQETVAKTKATEKTKQTSEKTEATKEIAQTVQSEQTTATSTTSAVTPSETSETSVASPIDSQTSTTAASVATSETASEVTASSTETSHAMIEGDGGQTAAPAEDRSDLNKPVPTDLLNSYREIIAQAGLDATAFTDEQLTQYFNAGVQYGDYASLLQLVANDEHISVSILLANYYQYNGKNSDGTDAVLPAETLQAYRNVIQLAGVDATTFSDEQLNSYYHEAHLSGDFSTLLRFVARDRGLSYEQLMATYQKAVGQ